MSTQSTKQLITVNEIMQDVIFLKDGSLRAILEVSAINFELRSEEEQTAITQNFQRFLNSIDFPIQIVAHSRKLDIKEYIAVVKDATDQLNNELLKLQGEEYAQFISGLADLANIMSKKFYISVPFYIYEKPTSAGVMDSVKGMFKTATPAKIPAEKFDAYRTQLMQRVELVFDGLIGLGLKIQLLEHDDIFQLLSGLYNPGTESDTKENAGEIAEA